MNLWHFLKRKFNDTNNREAARREVPGFVDLAFSLLQGGNYVEARRLLLRALERESAIENPMLLDWILTSLSTTWEQTEEYPEWTNFLSDFIARHRENAIAFQLRAWSHWYGGNLQEAIEDYSRALELKPNDATALSGRGQVFMECGEFSRALKDLDSALESIGAIPDVDANWKAQLEAYARNGRAATYAGLGDFARALGEFEKSMKLCPENAWVYFNWAEAYRNHGDLTNAIENYKLALTKKQPKLASQKRARAEKMLFALKD